jgi:mRNA-degrading endonuclease RelE of RelBE toxin-antitoxin system
MYQVRFLEDAQRDLARLDAGVAKRVARKLNWLATNAEAVEPTGLRSGLAGLAKLREGDFRIIY